jgi:DHA1 family tetracycline resistance protein-like MFS transporter
MSLWGMAGPASQSLMTRYVGPGEQGQLQGANTSLGSLAGVVAPVVFGVTFTFMASHPELPAPGAPFLLASGLLVAAAALAWRASLRVPERHQASPMMPSAAQDSP